MSSRIVLFPARLQSADNNILLDGSSSTFAARVTIPPPSLVRNPASLSHAPVFAYDPPPSPSTTPRRQNRPGMAIHIPKRQNISAGGVVDVAFRREVVVGVVWVASRRALDAPGGRAAMGDPDYRPSDRRYPSCWWNY